MQTKILEWAVVNEQINISKQKRINYKDILGMSLTKAVTKFRKAGVNRASEIINLLFQKYPNLSAEVKRRIEIGVNSRCAEQKTYEVRSSNESNS